jgi:predicted AlkP superfamily pyrophosphatase or phosphodiesterase
MIVDQPEKKSMQPKNQIIFPDYSNNNLGIISSLLRYYNIPCATPSISELDDELASKKYRNVVMVLMDAMGSRILEKNLSTDSFLRRNLRKELTAVYPCTTVCVTSSFFSGLQPVSHSWLAWSLYFKEWKQVIDLFPYRDSFTGDLIDRNEKNVLDFMNFDPILPKIEESTQGSVKIHCVFTDIARPRLVDLAGKYLTKIGSFESLLQTTLEKSREPGDHFIFSYYKSPDDLLHKNGLTHPEVSEFLEDIDRLFAEYADQFEDTLMIITADHGMQDINNHFYLNSVQPLNELLRNFPAGDPRAKFLYVHPGREDAFAERFKREFGNEFLLFSQDEFLSKKMLGEGRMHPKVKDFLGDFIACGIGNSDLLFAPDGFRPPKEFNGHHAGLTAEEMFVPLILVK